MAESAAVARALRDVLISPNESDSNFEPANMVDGLYAVSRSVGRLARVQALGAMLSTPLDEELKTEVMTSLLYLSGLRT